MISRLDDVDIPRLLQLDAEHEWFQRDHEIGRGLQRTISCQLHVAAYAWCPDHQPVVRHGPWRVSCVMARGMVVQPLVLVSPDSEGYLPAGGNISDWTPPSDPPEGAHALPGMVCFSDQWHPMFTLAWVAHQVARILAGEVLNFEAAPLSRRGRDFQASALARGTLPTHIVSAPRRELLYLDVPGAEICPECREIEFHDVAN